MNELLKISPITCDRDLEGLRSLYDTLESHTRSLLSLDVDSASYGALLSPIIMNHLPHQVRLTLSRDLRGKGWDLTALQTALRDEILAQETCVSPSSRNTDEIVNPEYSSASALLAKGQSTKPKIICVFCNGQHFSDKCSAVTDVSACKDLIRKSGRCYNCLNTDHISRNCPKSHKRCYYCKGNHNSAICERKDKKGVESKNMLVKAETSILLQTAAVNIINPNNNTSGY